MLGSIMRLSRHQKGLSSIENVHGFSRAMDNVKRKVNTVPGAVNLSRELSSRDGEEFPFHKEAGKLKTASFPFCFV